MSNVFELLLMSFGWLTLFLLVCVVEYFYMKMEKKRRMAHLRRYLSGPRF